MKISGQYLFFLIQTLRDSLQLPMGTDYCFSNKASVRKDLYEKILKDLLVKQKIHIDKPDIFNDSHL